MLSLSNNKISISNNTNNVYSVFGTKFKYFFSPTLAVIFRALDRLWRKGAGPGWHHGDRREGCAVVAVMGTRVRVMAGLVVRVLRLC